MILGQFPRFKTFLLSFGITYEMSDRQDSLLFDLHWIPKESFRLLSFSSAFFHFDKDGNFLGVADYDRCEFLKTNLKRKEKNV